MVLPGFSVNDDNELEYNVFGELSVLMPLYRKLAL